MEFHMKLPRNLKEMILFVFIISIISVNIIAPLITCFELGFSVDVWRQSLATMPFIWITVIVMVILTHKPASWMTNWIIHEDDSFGANITINILCNVFLMSIFMTVIGTWIGARQINMDAIRLFFFKWPRNFSISLLIELIIAQPIARLAISKLHKLS